MLPRLISTTSTEDQTISIVNEPIVADSGMPADSVFAVFVKIFSGSFYFATGESSTGMTQAFTSSDTVPPLAHSHNNPLHYRSAATGAVCVMSFIP